MNKTICPLALAKIAHCVMFLCYHGDFHKIFEYSSCVSHLGCATGILRWLFSRFRSLSTHDWKIDPFMYWIWRLETIFVFAVTTEHSLTDITNGEKADSQWLPRSIFSKNRRLANGKKQDSQWLPLTSILARVMRLSFPFLDVTRWYSLTRPFVT